MFVDCFLKTNMFDKQHEKRSYADVVAGRFGDLKLIELVCEYGGILYYKDKDGIIYDSEDLMVANYQPKCMLCRFMWHDIRFPGHSYAKYNNTEGYDVRDDYLYYKK